MRNCLFRNRRKLFAAAAAVYLLFAVALLYTYIPDEITVSGSTENLKLDIPATLQPIKESGDMEASSAVKASGTRQTYQCRLLGLIPLKQVEVVQAEEQSLYAVGMPVGIYMKMNHVLVVGTKELTSLEGIHSEPGKNIVQLGDYILSINDTEVTSKEQIGELVQESGGDKVRLRLQRDGETIEAAVEPVEVSGGLYQLGIWVKDDLAGVGTMTYFDENGSFGALGHGISDSDTGQMLAMGQGYLYHTTVLEISKSAAGEPGEVTGAISYGLKNQIGVIESNLDVGIYGTLNIPSSQRWYYREYPVGYKQEVEKDEAVVLFAVDGEVRAYHIAIDQIDYHAKEKNKSFVFHVDDPELMEATGGIVQGMSGAPIIQNGKIIGAVTHVFVNDPSRGYGIFIEDMLQH